MSANVMTVDDFRVLLEDVLDQSDLVVTPETTANDIRDWDSLSQIRLLVRIEKHYGIDLPIEDIEDANNVGELLALVNRILMD